MPRRLRTSLTLLLAALLAAPARALAADGGDERAVSVPAFAAIVIGVLVLLAVLAWALSHLLARDPPWLARSRHAVGEAGWRVSAAWAEFTDWMRLGR